MDGSSQNLALEIFDLDLQNSPQEEGLQVGGWLARQFHSRLRTSIPRREILNFFSLFKPLVGCPRPWSLIVKRNRSK